MLTRSELYSASSKGDPKDRLLSRYKVSDTGCWEYTASLDRYGYGRFAIGPRRLGAHKVSYVLHVGDVPAGKVVMHKCDNPACINPSHLMLGDVKDNVGDCIKKGRFPFVKHGALSDRIRKKRRSYINRKIFFAHNENEMIVFTDIAAVREAGFTDPNVYNCCSGKKDTYAGYQWYSVSRNEHPPAKGA